MPRRVRPLSAVVISLLLAVHARDAAAQSVSVDTSAVIDGAVVDSGGRALAGVEISLMDAQRMVRTDASGAYRIEHLEPGPHVLRFRRLGLVPVVLSVNLAAEDVTGVDVVMYRAAHQLAVVEVRTRGGGVRQLPADFVHRMQTGTGTYLTEEAVEARRAMRAEEIFRTVPGVRVLDGKIFSDRGINSIHSEPCPSGIPLYVNGAFAGGGDTKDTGLGQPGFGPSFGSAASGLDTIDPRDIAGIEIYRGPSGLPAGIPPSACGAVIVWTK